MVIATLPCESCGTTTGRHVPTMEEPSLDDLAGEVYGSADAEATDGCFTDPDGFCEHGHAAWQRYLGLI